MGILFEEPRLTPEMKQAIYERVARYVESSPAEIKSLLAVFPKEQLLEFVKKVIFRSLYPDEIIRELYMEFPGGTISVYTAAFKRLLRKTLNEMLVNGWDPEYALKKINERIPECCPEILSLINTSFRQFPNILREAFYKAKKEWEKIISRRKEKGFDTDNPQLALMLADTIVTLDIPLIPFRKPLYELDNLADTIIKIIDQVVSKATL